MSPPASPPASPPVSAPNAKPAGLKPRRGAFIVLLIVTIAWIIALLVMYFTTVHHAAR